MFSFKRIVQNLTENEDDFVKLIRARDNGEAWAQEQLDNLFQKNDPNLISRIDNARIRIYKKDAYRGVAKAQYYYGLSMRAFNKEESLSMLIPLAEQGNIDAMTAIASGYSEYGGYGNNLVEYMRWYTMAAEAGDINSQNTIALQYVIQQDYEKAFYWYSKSAQQKSSRGYSGMAKCYIFQKMKLYSDLQKPSQQEIEHVENEIEQCYLNALQYVSSQDEDEEACFGLAGHYREISNSIKNEETRLWIIKRAIYFYMAAYQCGNPNGLRRAKEISSEYDVNVNSDDIETWANDQQLFN